MATLQVPKVITKHVPKPTKGVIPTTMIFIGVDRVFNFIDGLVGSPLNRIGVNVPVLGRLDAEDIIAYMAVAGGAKFNTDTVIAFFANKLLFGQGAIGASIPRFNIPGISSPSTGTQVPAAIPSSQGAPL